MSDYRVIIELLSGDRLRLDGRIGARDLYAILCKRFQNGNPVANAGFGPKVSLDSVDPPYRPRVTDLIKIYLHHCS